MLRIYVVNISMSIIIDSGLKKCLFQKKARGMLVCSTLQVMKQDYNSMICKTNI